MNGGLLDLLGIVNLLQANWQLILGFVGFGGIATIIGLFVKPRLVSPRLTPPNNERAYFLRVERRGMGIAENCHAYLTVEGSRINCPTVWALNSVRVLDIAKEESIRLFQVSSDKIVFSSANPVEGFAPVICQLDEYKHRLLQVDVRWKGAIRGINWKMKINEIIAKSDKLLEGIPLKTRIKYQRAWICDDCGYQSGMGYDSMEQRDRDMSNRVCANCGRFMRCIRDEKLEIQEDEFGNIMKMRVVE